MSEEKDPELIVGPVYWRDLRAHAKREGLFLVATELDLCEVAEAIAADDTSKVEPWIRDGKLQRPTLEQLTSWDEDLDKRFVATVVQPFALAQLIEEFGSA